ncbi:glucuronate isomerase, partial [Geobacillus thermoleovorans]
AVIEINRPSFLDYVGKLGEAAGLPIHDYNQLLQAIESRVRYFHEKGCRMADHGLESMPYSECGWKEANDIFQKRKNGFVLSR